jgi:hypothetical protein
LVRGRSAWPDLLSALVAQEGSSERQPAQDGEVMIARFAEIRRRAFDGKRVVWALHPITWEPAESPACRQWVIVGVYDDFDTALAAAREWHSGLAKQASAQARAA